MATQPSQATLDAVQATMANVEAAFKATNAQRTALSVLIAVGKATCSDIKAYNLQVKAVYAYQASVSGIIRANGGQAPSVPPPVYIAYRGISGEQAANIDCSSAQMRGWAPAGLGDYYVNPTQVEWRQEVLPSDAATVSQIVSAAGQAAAVPAGQLGAVQLAAVVPLIIYGIIVIVVAVIALKIAEVLGDIFGKKQTTQQIAIQAEQHTKTLEARAVCYTDCTGRGKDPVECGKICSRVLPQFVAQFPGGGLGLFGTILGVAVLGTAVYAGYRYVSAGGFASRSGSGHKTLPAAGDDYDDDEGIDVGPGAKVFPKAA